MSTATREEVLAMARNRTMTNVQHLARAVGVGPNAIYEAIARGEWTATRVLRVGRKILIPTADIVALVSSGDEPTAA